jgi:hypothetical protein
MNGSAGKEEVFMGDLRQPRWMYLKAVLFVVIGIVAGGMLLLDSPRMRTGLLLALTVWAFCRAYYFAFYVIEHYIDPSFRFSGLFSAVRFILRHPRH